ncbi:DUF6735 family protein [Haloglomus halophilum]|uniref:DUF6735 family protein n=1 Tax=Haloglomus halophilum TaxID=2962672 RepID=UPI0020CA0184|nr:DUF6735 family protein [Haloglomus halophilum]
MSERALVAYERPDGRYTLHYAHRSDGLADCLAPATPFGGADPRAEWAAALLRDLLTATDPPESVRVPDDAVTAVDPRPLAVAVPWGRLPGHVDFGAHEALYVVDRAFAVVAYLAVPFDLAPHADAIGRASVDPARGGVLVPVEGSLDALRERAAGAREALGAAVDRGFAPAAARRAVRETAARWVGPDRLLVAECAPGRSDAGP